jgi:thiol-disulfide isomerase/thioredoxin
MTSKPRPTPRRRKPRPVQAPKARAPERGPGSRWVLWAGLAAVVAVAAVLAAVLRSGGDDETATAQVQVAGTPLPELGDEDAAVGNAAPGLAGEDLTGAELSIPTGGGRPRLVIFLAHWCPHCQAEVPRIVAWYQATGGVEGVDVYGVATANDSRRPNYPAQEWLAEAGWPYPTLLDDGANTAAAAYGLSRYPFFVFVDGAGNVVSRATGELPVEEIESRLVTLQQAAPLRQ